MLAAGAILGIAMAAAGFIDVKSQNIVPEGVVAQVNDKYIGEEKFITVLNGLAADKRAEITREDRAYILERLIEEELLVQRSVELGMLDSDTVVRNALVQAMIGSVIAERAGEAVPEARLRSFYEDHIDFFDLPDRLHVRRIVFRVRSKSGDNREQGFEQALVRAKEAYSRLKQGVPYQTVARSYGDETAVEIPNTLLSPNKLREYIGPTLLEASLKLEPGGISKPLETPSGYAILYMVDRKDGREQRFEIIRKQVEAEYRKRRDDRALREYVEQLKEGAQIKRAVL
jgi:parvulin-like peptidyl-prolyl isomerase